jgi:pimeloyl-ACP methyl ester carboxylesterase
MKTPFYQNTPQMIETRHAKIAYWKVGQGPDLVFFHGWPLSSITYRGVVERLQDQFTCHLYDFPGAGKTIDKGAINLDVILQSSRELLAQLGLARYVSIAHDSGALVARILAQDNPSVAGLVMGNTEIPGHHSPIVKLLADVSKLPGGVFALQQLMKIQKVRCSRFGFGGAFHSQAFIEGEFYRLVLGELLSSSEDFLRSFLLLRSFDFSFVDRLAEVHQNIQAPVKFIWGKKDRIFPLEKAMPMLSQFPKGATMETIEEGRCFAHEEFSGDFVAHALPFLQKNLS